MRLEGRVGFEPAVSHCAVSVFPETPPAHIARSDSGLDFLDNPVQLPGAEKEQPFDPENRRPRDNCCPCSLCYAAVVVNSAFTYSIDHDESPLLIPPLYIGRSVLSMSYAFTFAAACPATTVGGTEICIIPGGRNRTGLQLAKGGRRARSDRKRLGELHPGPGFGCRVIRHAAQGRSYVP